MKIKIDWFGWVWTAAVVGCAIADLIPWLIAVLLLTGKVSITTEHRL